MQVEEKTFGKLNDKEVPVITLTNKNGVSLSATPYGATVVAWRVPDKKGNFDNIVLGFEQLDEYAEHRPYYGATIGRIAGRIAAGKFTLDGKEYEVAKNENGAHHLHGGLEGLDTKLWDYQTEENETEARIVFTYLDEDGSNGYPGNLTLQVTYTLTDEDEWKVAYSAKTDQPTLFNPTNHVYFNLLGDFTHPIVDHKLFVDADFFAELDEGNIPTGKLLPVTGTPFDFWNPTPLAQAVEGDHSQTKQVGGLDHPFVLNQKSEGPSAVISEKSSGRKIEMDTDQPAVVIFLHNGEINKYQIADKPVIAYAGLTLETQKLPDAINQEGFGDIVLRPGDEYKAETVYRFVLDEE